jgi:hypothetical protein
MSQPYFPYGMRGRYPLDKKPGEAWGLSGSYGETKNIFSMSGIETLFLGRQAFHRITVPTELLPRGESQIPRLLEARYISH